MGCDCLRQAKREALKEDEVVKKSKNIEDKPLDNENKQTDREMKIKANEVVNGKYLD